VTGCKPIFVSGIGRSGTSALLTSIAEHPSVIQKHRIGEAPFVSAFLNFLSDFEDTSVQRDYNRKNYRLEHKQRSAIFGDLITLIQSGKLLRGEEYKDSYWVAKVSLSESAYKKAIELYSEVRCVYIKRNGVEVVNSAMNHPGFKNLTFGEQCDRWKESLVACSYLSEQSLCSIIKHDQLVNDPVGCFERVFKDLKIPANPAPASWIRTNLFNSSFDDTSNGEITTNKFNSRLSSAWACWSVEQKREFVSRCDETMIEHGFERPYLSEKYSFDTLNRKEDVVLSEPTLIENSRQENDNKYAYQILDIVGDRIYPDMFNYLCNISVKYNYMFVNNPKVASTTVLRELQRLENEEKAMATENPHARRESPLSRLDECDFSQQVHFLQADQVFRFAFVRDPFERVLSAYLSKIDKPLSGYCYDNRKPNSVPPKAEIISIVTQRSIDENTDFSMRIGFESFVDAICQQKPADMDPHWKPQRDVIMPDKISYDFIGRLEQFNTDFEHIMKRIGIANVVIPGYSENRTKSESNLKRYYTTDLKYKIYEKYETDFKEFGYEVDLKKVVGRVA